jgi:hypothetical protein
MYLYPVGAAPTAGYGMTVPTVANAPTAGYMMQSSSMMTVANAPQATMVQLGSAPAATTTTNGGMTWTVGGVGNAPTAVGNAPSAVGTAPPAAPADAHLKDEGKRMDVFNDLKDAYPEIRAETPDSRVNRRIKMTDQAKKLFATAIGSDFNADSPDAADQTDIDQMVSAIMKADPAYAWSTANGATGAAPGMIGAAPGAAQVYYMYPQPQPQVPLVPYVPVVKQHHHHLLHK